jgi:sugar O-acyltransferase (sialic acid O-acetyltransferase NeuD family)
MKVFLFGAANPETIRMIRAVERVSGNIKFAGFLDNDPEKNNVDFYGYPILGGIEMVNKLSGPDTGFVNLITGNTRTRYEVSKAIVTAGGRLTNFIHPSIDLTMCRIGVGIYLQESVVTQANVEIGDNSSIHIGALIGHETIIGESVFIAHACSVSGCCHIGDGVFVGTNATILPRINVGKWATIGAGAVITKDIPDYAVVVGNPGKIVKFNEEFI